MFKTISKILLALTFLFSFNKAMAQDQPLGVIAFYNLENLFDTADDPDIRDEEYLPKGSKEWTEERYQLKLEHMSRVISEIAMGPDIIGVCEIENRKVLEDLVKMPSLTGKKYGIVQFDSPDERGIDVALLYRTNKFQPFEVKTIAFEHPDRDDYKTRDILWVKGLYFSDTLNVVVNHWPSRYGGGVQERNIAAKILRKAVDSVLNQNDQAKIVIMGDFNDDPTDRSIKKTLNARGKRKKLDEKSLFNTATDIFKKGYGTLYYRGLWNLFDQIIVSQSLLKENSSNYFFMDDSFKIFAPDWMRQQEGNYKGAPKRTFVGDKFTEGYSDHFPSFIYIAK